MQKGRTEKMNDAQSSANSTSGRMRKGNICLNIFCHSFFGKTLLVPRAIKIGSTMVGGLVEIAAACERLWQSQSGMNLEFPPAPIPAGPMPDIASLRPWQILPPGSRPRITLAADANTESSVGWELGYRTSRTDHSLVILRARDVRGGNSFERQTVTDAAEQN